MAVAGEVVCGAVACDDVTPTFLKVRHHRLDPSAAAMMNCAQHLHLQAGGKGPHIQLLLLSNTPLTTSLGAMSASLDPLVSPSADAAAARTCRPGTG
jgi:hypothetical protein